MKRFTETDKWRDPWFRSLTAPSKLVFFYILDHCNNAGFHELDKELMVIMTGMKKEHVDGALMGLKRAIIGPCEGWYWVRRFLRHQKNDELNPANPAHKQIITLLRDQLNRFKVDLEFQEFLKNYKGLLSPIGIGKGTVKVRKRESPEREKQVESIYSAYPKKVARPEALKAIGKALESFPFERLLDRTQAYAKARNGNLDFVPHPATWFNNHQFNDDPSTWSPNGENGKQKIPTKLDSEYEQWMAERKEKKK